MTKKTIKRVGFFVSIFITATVCFSSIAYPITTSNATVPPEASEQAASQRTVTLRTEFFIGIKNNVLYTETNNYSLENVRITYRPAQLSELASPNSKKSVELIFLNNVLKQAIIHR
jgi:uncharacterized membrane protein